MSDLLRIDTVVQVFSGTTVLPSANGGTSPEVNIALEVQVNLGDFIGPVKRSLASGVSDIALTLPSPPYNAVFWFETDTPVEINVNGQGYVLVSSAFLSMAATTTVLVRNIIIPPDALVPAVATVRHFAGKIAT